MRPMVQAFPVARLKVDELIAKARKEVWRSALANLRRGGLPLAEFVGAIRSDPLLLVAGPVVLADVLLKRG